MIGTFQRGSSYIPTINCSWNVGNPPFPTVTSASTTVIFSPTASQHQCYNHNAYLFRTAFGSNRIHLLHVTHDQDEDGAGQYMRGMYSDDEGITWSSYSTIIPSWEAMDLTHTVNAHLAYFAGTIISNNVQYLVYDVNICLWSTTGDRLPYGVLAQPIVNDVFGTPVWVYGGNGDTVYSQAPLNFKTTFLTDMMARGNVLYLSVSTNAIWPRSPSGAEENLTEGASIKTSNSYWTRYSRAYNNLSASQYSVQIQNSINGIDWSYPINSPIPNSPSRLFFLKHSNGTWCFASNPYTYLSIFRDPLIVAFSTDAINWTSAKTIRLIGSDTPVYAGYAKDCAASYPSLIQLLNGKILSVYSIFKETIAITQFSIP